MIKIALCVLTAFNAIALNGAAVQSRTVPVSSEAVNTLSRMDKLHILLSGLKVIKYEYVNDRKRCAYPYLRCDNTCVDLGIDCQELTKCGFTVNDLPEYEKRKDYYQASQAVMHMAGGLREANNTSSTGQLLGDITYARVGSKDSTIIARLAHERDAAGDKFIKYDFYQIHAVGVPDAGSREKELEELIKKDTKELDANEKLVAHYSGLLGEREEYTQINAQLIVTLMQEIEKAKKIKLDNGTPQLTIQQDTPLMKKHKNNEQLKLEDYYGLTQELITVLKNELVNEPVARAGKKLDNKHKRSQLKYTVAAAGTIAGSMALVGYNRNSWSVKWLCATLIAGAVVSSALWLRKLLLHTKFMGVTKRHTETLKTRKNRYNALALLSLGTTAGVLANKHAQWAASTSWIVAGVGGSIAVLAWIKHGHAKKELGNYNLKASQDFAQRHPELFVTVKKSRVKR